jgi:hypothetical protein
MSDDDMCEHGIPREALNLNSAGYPDHGCCGDLPLQGKIPTAELGIEPWTSSLVVRSSDHQTMRPDDDRKVSSTILSFFQMNNVTASGLISPHCTCSPTLQLVLFYDVPPDTAMVPEQAHLHGQ